MLLDGSREGSPLSIQHTETLQTTGRHNFFIGRKFLAKTKGPL